MFFSRESLTVKSVCASTMSHLSSHTQSKHSWLVFMPDFFPRHVSLVYLLVYQWWVDQQTWRKKRQIPSPLVSLVLKHLISDFVPARDVFSLENSTESSDSHVVSRIFQVQKLPVVVSFFKCCCFSTGSVGHVTHSLHSSINSFNYYDFFFLVKQQQ